MKHDGKKILVVEDNYVVASMIQFILQAEGFEVLIAHDGDEAVDLLLEHDPDLIISDIMLPKVDGFVFTNIVRRMSDIPIILLTALVGASHKSRGMAAGANDYITKPFDPGDLVHRVKNALEQA